MSLQHAAVHRAHRLQQRRALLELRGLGVDALDHQADLGVVLAAQAAQLERLLGELAAGVADVAQDLVLDLLRALLHHLLEHLRGAAAAAARRARPRASAGGCSFSATSSPSTRAASACRADSGNTRCSADAEGARRLALLLGDLRLDLLERGQRVDQRIDLVQHDEARRRLGAEMVAPDRQVGLGDAGVGAEDEDGGVRRRQQAERQLRLGADRVQARRVEDDQALRCSSGCG